MESFFVEVKFFRFWLKTMDYNKAFLPKSRSFFVVFLLVAGMSYEDEIRAILFYLRYPFIWYSFWPKFQITIDYYIVRHFSLCIDLII